MTVEEYKERYFNRWQKRIFIQCKVIFILLTVLTAAITAFLYYKADSVSFKVPLKMHLALRVFTPFLLQLTVLSITQLLLAKKSFPCQTNCRLVILNFFWLMTTVSVFYNTYSMTMILPGLTMLLAAMVMDKKLMRALLFVSLAVLVASFLTWHFLFTELELKHQLISIALILAAYVIIYRIAREILRTQKSQTEFIFNSYKKQRKLAEELKLEPLTRLYNRQALSDTVNSLLKSLQKKKDEACIVFLDLDNFKTVNDVYGHAAGDAVLLSLAEIIVHEMGTNRNAFRYGGDEFVLIFHEKNLAEIICHVEKIMNEFRSTKFDYLPEEAHCSMSVGIAFYKDGWHSKEWFKAADEAAYRAKQNGKNRYEIAE